MSETAVVGKTVSQFEFQTYRARLTFTDGTIVEFSTSLIGPNGEHSCLTIRSVEPEMCKQCRERPATTNYTPDWPVCSPCLRSMSR